MKRVLLFTVVLILTPTLLNAQYWKVHRSSFFGAIGTNHFMGDLGGGKKDAAHFLGVRDIDIQGTRPTFQGGYRFRLFRDVSVKALGTYAVLSASDKMTKSYGRRARNLGFRSSLVELSAQVEYYFIGEKMFSKAYFGSNSSNIGAYVFLGTGGIYFNPKGKHEDENKWVALQPLGTEGQFANPDGTPFEYYYDGVKYQTPKPYKRVAAIFSIGLGLKYELSQAWSLGVELSTRYTTTDYLDDTHDRYFNYAEMGLEAPSPYSDYFANRSLKYVSENGKVIVTDEPAEKVTGQPFRGSPNYGDSYIFATVLVYKRIGITMRRRPKFK